MITAVYIIYHILAILIGSIIGAKLAVIIYNWEERKKR